MNEAMTLGQRGLGLNPTTTEQQVAADLDHLGTQVNPDNVLQIRNIVLGAAQRLDDALYTQGRNIHVGPPGGDPISRRAAEILSIKSRALIDELRSHVEAYRRAGENLGQIARNYGHTEQSINDSFKSFIKANQETWGRQLQWDQDVARLPRLGRELLDPPHGSRRVPNSLEELLGGGLE
jgi:hypothetical protein